MLEVACVGEGVGAFEVAWVDCTIELRELEVCGAGNADTAVDDVAADVDAPVIVFVFETDAELDSPEELIYPD